MPLLCGKLAPLPTHRTRKSGQGPLMGGPLSFSLKPSFQLCALCRHICNTFVTVFLSLDKPEAVSEQVSRDGSRGWVMARGKAAVLSEVGSSEGGADSRPRAGPLPAPGGLESPHALPRMTKE